MKKKQLKKCVSIRVYPKDLKEIKLRYTTMQKFVDRMVDIERLARDIELF